MSPWVKPTAPGPRCAETAGFLFSHPCDRPPAHACGACGKPICAEHTRLASGQPLCVSCARERPLIDDRDPYFYRSVHYGYGGFHHHGSSGVLPDPNDFTDGDASSLQQQGDETFEDDLDAS
jgi:hypothetical protein